MNNLYAPLKFFVWYILFTLLLHVFGPWSYEDEEFFKLIIFMFVAMALFALGYVQEIVNYTNYYVKSEINCDVNFNKYKKVAIFGLLFNVFVTLFVVLSDISSGAISLKNILNPGQTYINALELAKEATNSSLAVQLKTIFSALVYFSNVFLLLNYRKIDKKIKNLLVTVLIFNLFYGALKQGAQKGVFDLLILFSSVSFLRCADDYVLFKRWIKYSIIFLLAAVIVFGVFQISRMSAYDALGYSGAHRMILDRGGYIFYIFGDNIGLAVSLFIGYVSQGYYGLSLCLELPFEWTYGIGNSFALMSYAGQYFDIYGVEDKTYPFRMDENFQWPAKMYWHTFFPWVASDLTFGGSLLLMYFVGKVYAKSFMDSLFCENPFSACMFYFMTTLLLYLPANNQLMQTREMMIGFVVLFASWLFLGGVRINDKLKFWINLK